MARKKIQAMPAKEILEKEAEEATYKELAEKYGVSSSTIGRWFKTCGIHKYNSSSDLMEGEDGDYDDEEEDECEEGIHEIFTGTELLTEELDGVYTSYVVAGVQILSCAAASKPEKVIDSVKNELGAMENVIENDNFRIYDGDDPCHYFAIFKNAYKKDIIDHLKEVAAKLEKNEFVDIVFNVQNGANYIYAGGVVKDVSGMLDYMAKKAFLKDGWKWFDECVEDDKGNEPTSIAKIDIPEEVAAAVKQAEIEEKAAEVKTAALSRQHVYGTTAEVSKSSSDDNDEILDTASAGSTGNSRPLSGQVTDDPLVVVINRTKEKEDCDTAALKDIVNVRETAISHHRVNPPVKMHVPTSSERVYEDTNEKCQMPSEKVFESNEESDYTEDEVSEVFLVDSENVSASWKQYINRGPSRQIKILYTESTPKMSYADVAEILKNPEGISMEKVYPGEKGASGLDFQLVTILGYEICAHPARKYFIVSRDKGYAPVIKYWRDKGYDVEQLEVINRPLPAGEKPFSLLSDDEKSALKDDCTSKVEAKFKALEPGGTTDKGRKFDKMMFLQKTVPNRKKNVYETLINIIDTEGTNNATKIRADMIDIFGGANGTKMFNFLKKELKNYPV